MKMQMGLNTRNIRIVWILSIVSMVLLIVVQSWNLYRLFIQEANRQFEETIENISSAIADNATSMIIYKNSNIEDVVSQHSNTKSLISDPLVFEGINPEKLDVILQRMTSDIKNRFSVTEYDSIFTHNNIYTQELQIACSDSSVTDDWHYYSYYPNECKLHFHFVLNPLENKILSGTYSVGMSDIIENMLYMVLVSIVMIIVVVVCLVYQIRTILWQMKVNEMRNSIIITMVHELRRPVQSLKTFISFLRNKQLRQDEGQTEQIIEDSTFELDNMTAYLSTTREMARGFQERTPLKLSHFEVNSLVDRIVRMANTLHDKRVTINKYYNAQSIYVNADFTHIANCIRNLVENSLKYSGSTVSIDIETSVKGKDCHICISDDGFGIDSSEKDYIFEPFFRSPRFNRSEIPGLGLGLNYVRHILTMHKGKLVLNPTKVGASFTIIIPLQ